MKDITTQPDISIRRAKKKLSQVGEKCLVIIGSQNKLLGTLCDGDLRKAILKGAGVGDSIKGHLPARAHGVYFKLKIHLNILSHLWGPLYPSH